MNSKSLAEIHRTLSIISNVDLFAKIVEVGNISFSDSNVGTAS